MRKIFLIMVLICFLGACCSFVPDEYSAKFAVESAFNDGRPMTFSKIEKTGTDECPNFILTETHPNGLLTIRYKVYFFPTSEGYKQEVTLVSMSQY